MSDVARYRRVYVHDWHHPEFRRLDDGARIVRLYLSAGPQTTSVGVFRLSTAVAVEDLGGSADDFERRLQTVCEAFNWQWDGVARVIFLTDWFDNNAPANPNVIASWVKLLRNVPDCEVRTAAITSLTASIKTLPQSFRDAWKDLPKSFLKAESEGKPRTETPQGSGTRERKTREQAEGIEGNGHSDIPFHERAIARKTAEFCNEDEPETEKIKAFLRFWDIEHPNSEPNRNHINPALALAFSEKQARRRTATV